MKFVEGDGRELRDQDQQSEAFKIMLICTASLTSLFLARGVSTAARVPLIRLDLRRLMAF